MKNHQNDDIVKTPDAPPQGADVEEALLLRIKGIKKKIARLGEIRPGTLTEQYNVCGRKNCRCKDKANPQKHGPYYQLSYTRNGKSTSEFVREDDLKRVRGQLADYQKFAALKDEWVGASIDLAKLRRERRKAEKA